MNIQLGNFAIFCRRGRVVAATKGVIGYQGCHSPVKNLRPMEKLPREKPSPREMYASE